jgi:acyl dehydratase
VVALLGVTWDFLAPTRAGDTIRAEIAVKGKREVRNSDHGFVELLIEFVNQGGVIAQTGTVRLLMRRSLPVSAKWG